MLYPGLFLLFNQRERFNKNTNLQSPRARVWAPSVRETAWSISCDAMQKDFSFAMLQMNRIAKKADEQKQGQARGKTKHDMSIARAWALILNEDHGVHLM
jgi:hypothetical protein